MTIPADDFLLQLARRKGVLDEEQLASAHQTMARHALSGAPAPRVCEVLLAMGALDERKFLAAVADEFGMAVVQLEGLTISPEILALVPEALATRHRLLPYAKNGDKLIVAISDPLELDGVDRLSKLLNLPVESTLASPTAILAAIQRNYGNPSRAEINAGVGIQALAGEVRGAGDADSSTENLDAPVISYVTSLITEAVQKRASDIHLEPLEKRLRVRYRIDGVLLEAASPPQRLQLAIVSRLKIMADISIAEKRIPQDGRIQVAIAGRAVDLRVSSLPTAHGESIVMRVLEQESLKVGLAELGFERSDQTHFERMLELPDGMVLVTGPTGSGKTTTLYSCLHHLNKPERKIITVEDPVEYQLSGVNQVPVRHDVGMTFASALRAMLRQAPNIVMIGEIRDLETAEIAINASLTGHLVFSTLHTNDAPGAVTRLIDLGAKPYLVSTAIRAVLAQRLVRKVCRKCSQPYSPAAHELRSLGFTTAAASSARFLRGTGCADCSGTGYRGRMGIFELLETDEQIQRMIHDGASASALRSAARGRGMSTMREDGARKVSAGLTTIEEVVSITVGDAS